MANLIQNIRITKSRFITSEFLHKQLVLQKFLKKTKNKENSINTTNKEKKGRKIDKNLVLPQVKPHLTQTFM